MPGIDDVVAALQVFTTDAYSFDQVVKGVNPVNGVLSEPAVRRNVP